MRPWSSATGMNSTGAHRAEVAVGPAGQRLVADGLAGVEADDGLVVDLDPLVGHGPAQPVGQVEAPGPGRAQGAVEDLDAGPTPLLGPVHGHVGVAQQRLGGELVGRRCVAMPMLAVTTTSRSVGQPDRLGDALADRARRRLGRGRLGGAGQHDDELVTGQAADGRRRVDQVDGSGRRRCRGPGHRRGGRGRR